MSTADLAPPSESTSPRTVWSVLAAWCVVALLAAATGVVGRLPPPLFPMLIWGPVLVAALAWRRSPALRAFGGSIDLRLPVLFHAIRVFFGAAFLVEAAAGRLPSSFANVAGPGDLVVGALALPAALLARRDDRPSRALLSAWNLLGLVDILAVFLSAQRMLLVLRDERFLHAFQRLPFSALPVLVVPLILLTHLLVFVRLRAAARAT